MLRDMIGQYKLHIVGLVKTKVRFWGRILMMFACKKNGFNVGGPWLTARDFNAIVSPNEVREPRN